MLTLVLRHSRNVSARAWLYPVRAIRQILIDWDEPFLRPIPAREP